MPNQTKTPREELHHKVRNEFATAIARYYKIHPERLDDPNLNEGTKAMLALLEGVLGCIDLFEVTRIETLRPGGMRATDPPA